MPSNRFSPVQLVGLGRLRSVGRRHDGLRGNPQPDCFDGTADAVRLRSDSLGFEPEVNGDRNVRGNGLAAPCCWFVSVLLQGFHRGLAQ
jgi:hypothetical protein